MCSTHPVSVQNNVSFVVDLTKLKDRNDIRAFVVKIRDDDCLIVNEMTSDAAVVYVRRQYHVHTTDPDLHRMIAFMENKNVKGQ